MGGCWLGSYDSVVILRCSRGSRVSVFVGGIFVFRRVECDRGVFGGVIGSDWWWRWSIGDGGRRWVGNGMGDGWRRRWEWVRTSTLVAEARGATRVFDVDVRDDKVSDRACIGDGEVP